MEEFNVKVIKAGKSTYWYADKISKVFKVIGVDENKARKFIVENPNIEPMLYIEWDDCEITDEETCNLTQLERANELIKMAVSDYGGGYSRVSLATMSDMEEYVQEYLQEDDED